MDQKKQAKQCDGWWREPKVLPRDHFLDTYDLISALTSLFEITKLKRWIDVCAVDGRHTLAAGLASHYANHPLDLHAILAHRANAPYARALQQQAASETVGEELGFAWKIWTHDQWRHRRCRAGQKRQRRDSAVVRDTCYFTAVEDGSAETRKRMSRIMRRPQSHCAAFVTPDRFLVDDADRSWVVKQYIVDRGERLATCLWAYIHVDCLIRHET